LANTALQQRVSMSKPTGCSACRDGKGLDFPISMAFQPIIDIHSREVFAHEALVRGGAGESAGSLLGRLNQDNLYAFDQSCRVTALEWAARLQLPGKVSINFMPNAVYKPETCIRATLEAAERFKFPLSRIIFEVTEQEQVLDIDHLTGILRAYRKQGFMTAIDDFGAGYAGLNLLADFQPDLIKLDMQLIRGIDRDTVRQILVETTLQMCRKLNIRVIAEGVETLEEFKTLREMGIGLFQGYLLAKPGFQSLPAIHFPE
jgi:EAL domain-containing protein (putative c-di-GMP-specific phosphodiesterase class I)